MVLLAIKYSPIKDGKAPPSLEILDQLLLPHESTYIPIRTCEEAHDAIKTMKVRGAPAIAIVAALSLAVEVGNTLLQEKSFGGPQEARDHIGQRLEYLKTSRPTAVNLGDAVTKLKAVITHTEAASSPAAGERSIFQAFLKAAEQMLVDDVSDNKAIGEYGSSWVQQCTVPGQQEQGLKILTICNTGSLATAGYGTALGVIRSLHSANKLEQAYCLETRPYNQGSRLTAYELVHDQIPATLLTDSMAASLMSREKAKLAAVVVGADRVAANGDTANKIGTYSLAVLAKYHGIKFLVAAPRTTIDLNTPSGESIIVEQRAAEELTRVRGPMVQVDGTIDTGKAATISTAADGINVWNPAFDITPADLIDGVITEVGVVEKIDGKFDFEPIYNSSG